MISVFMDTGFEVLERGLGLQSPHLCPGIATVAVAGMAPHVQRKELGDAGEVHAISS